MTKKYFILALRNFRRNRAYTFINVLGLSIGLTACIIIFLVISYDLNFDKFHSKYPNIYRVVQDVDSGSGTTYSAVTPYPLVKAFRNDFPDVPLATQMHYQGEAMLSVDGEKLMVDDILFADSLFFEIFDFKVLSGNPKVELGEPGKVFVTKSLANKILKGGEITRFKITTTELEVAGIIADPPPNSHINFSMVVSMPSFTSEFIAGFPLDRWGVRARGYAYIVLPEKISFEAIESRFKPFVQKYHNDEEAKRTTQKLQPLGNIHFDQQYLENPGRVSNVDMKDLAMMSILGIFILFIACINFINLATALSEKKAKEIGIRKTLGAQRSQLTFYFLSETFLLTLFAVLLSLGATEWLLNWLNPFLEKQINLALFSNYTLIIFLVALIIFTTLLAGFYPALVLSRFSPMAVLKNNFTTPGSSGTFVRKGLVVCQFLIAQVLIISTLIVSDQMEYFRTKPLGFDQETVVVVSLPENKKMTRDALRTRLETIPGVRNLSFSVGTPVSDNRIYTGFFLTEAGIEGGSYKVNFKSVDRNYLETYNIRLVAGRWFDESDEKMNETDIPEKDRRVVYVLNESAVERLGFGDAQEIIGKFVTTGVGDISAEVIGVLEDFHVTSLHSEIEPVVFAIMPNFYYEAGLKLNTGDLQRTLALIEKNWSEVLPEFYYEFEFLDDHVASLYQNEEKTFQLFKIFAGVSIFIGCLGLYGLISFVASQKRKEVGIRKVMGASVSSILVLFSTEFVRLVVIAFALATPLVWYFMGQWLQNFAYKIDIPWTKFIVGFMATLVIVLLTILYRSVKAAKMNPAITLRSE